MTIDVLQNNSIEQNFATNGAHDRTQYQTKHQPKPRTPLIATRDDAVAYAYHFKGDMQVSPVTIHGGEQRLGYIPDACRWITWQKRGRKQFSERADQGL